MKPEQLFRELLPELNHWDSPIYNEHVYTVKFTRSQVSSYVRPLLLCFYSEMLHSTSRMSPLVFPRVFLFEGDESQSILETSRTAIMECIHLINEL